MGKITFNLMDKAPDSSVLLQKMGAISIFPPRIYPLELLLGT